MRVPGEASSPFLLLKAPLTPLGKRDGTERAGCFLPSPYPLKKGAATPSLPVPEGEGGGEAAPFFRGGGASLLPEEAAWLRTPYPLNQG